MLFSEKLQLCRKVKGLSQEQLAEQLEVSRQAVSKWESGAAMPEWDKLIQLSRIFAVSADYLLKDELEIDPLQAGPEPAAAPKKPRNTRSDLILCWGLELLGAVLLILARQAAQGRLICYGLAFAAQIAGCVWLEIFCGRAERAEAAQTRRLFYGVSVWALSFMPIAWFAEFLYYLPLFMRMYQHLPGIKYLHGLLTPHLLVYLLISAVVSLVLLLRWRAVKKRGIGAK